MVLQRPTLTPHPVYVCDLKPELVYNLEQLSFFLKADCLQDSSDDQRQFTAAATVACEGCRWPCDTREGCPRFGICCPWDRMAFLVMAKEFNAYYRNHSKELFCPGHGCGS